jgi:hypothetical protein
MISCLFPDLFSDPEAVCSSETSVKFYQTSWCHIPEDLDLINKRSLCVDLTKKLKLNSVTLVRERTIPTERPPHLS